MIKSFKSNTLFSSLFSVLKINTFKFTVKH